MELITSNDLGKVRREWSKGREYLVAPMTMIVGNTVLSGSKGSLLYPAEEVSRDAHTWNGVPLLLNHPMTPDGRHISGRDPAVLERQQIGHVFNAYSDGKDLNAEAWFDVKWCEELDRRVLIALQEGRPIELSTGLFTDDTPSRGVANGRQYTHIARNYRPDHLAILLTQAGACSVPDGCGVLVNQEYKRDVWEKLGEALGVIGNGANDVTTVESDDDFFKRTGGKGEKLIRRMSQAQYDQEQKAKKAAEKKTTGKKKTSYPSLADRLAKVQEKDAKARDLANRTVGGPRPLRTAAPTGGVSPKASGPKTPAPAAKKPAGATPKPPIAKPKKNAFEQLMARLPGMSQSRNFGKFGPVTGGYGSGPVHRASQKGFGSVQEVFAQNALNTLGEELLGRILVNAVENDASDDAFEKGLKSTKFYERVSGKDVEVTGAKRDARLQQARSERQERIKKFGKSKPPPTPPKQKPTPYTGPSGSGAETTAQVMARKRRESMGISDPKPTAKKPAGPKPKPPIKKNAFEQLLDRMRENAAAMKTPAQITTERNAKAKAARAQMATKTTADKAKRAQARTAQKAAVTKSQTAQKAKVATDVTARTQKHAAGVAATKAKMAAKPKLPAAVATKIKHNLAALCAAI